MWFIFRGYWSYYKYVYMLTLSVSLVMGIGASIKRGGDLRQELIIRTILASLIVGNMLVGIGEGLFQKWYQDKRTRYYALLPVPIYRLGIIRTFTGMPLFLFGGTFLLAVFFIFLGDRVQENAVVKLLAVHGLMLNMFVFLQISENLLSGLQERYKGFLDEKKAQTTMAVLMLILLMLVVRYLTKGGASSATEALAFNLVGFVLAGVNIGLFVRRRSYLT